MEVINLSEQNSLVGQFMSEVRDKVLQQERLRFRTNIHRLAQIMAYEISKRLRYREVEVETPLGVKKTRVIDDRVVLATILRAGLPLHQGFLNVFDHSENGFVSAFRFYKDSECREVDVHVEYMASPDLTGKTLIVADPMLAKGHSMELGLVAFLKNGMPRRIILASVIASQEGVDHIVKCFGGYDNVELWCATIDPILNEHSYIVPGLGDAGDLAFGGKI